MNAVVKGSVGLAVAVAVVSALIAVAGLHKNPIFGIVAVVVFMALNVGAVCWVLKQTAGDNGYGKQLVNGLLLGVIAGVLIFGFSYLMTTVLFPNYMDEYKDGMIAMMESSGMPQDQLEAQVARVEAATPLRQAISGTIGTFVTSLIAAAIAGIWMRKK